MKTAKVVAFEGSGIPMSLQAYPLRAIAPDEVLVRVLYTTICGSDLHTYCGLRKEATPTVLGHEITGCIEEIGSGHSHTDHAGAYLQRGNRVTWSVFASDPGSPYSLQGMPQKGAGLFKYGHAQIAGQEVFHGGLAEYCILKKGTALFKIPDAVPLPVAATINCAVATVAGAIRLAGSHMQGKTVLITGMGLLGINCVAMCHSAGAAKIIVADNNPSRLQTALQFGAHVTLALEQGNPGNRQLSGVDIVFDMSGAPDAMEFGLETLAIGGTAIWVGAVFHTRSIQLNAEQVIRNMLTIKGLHNYNYEDLQAAVGFISENWSRYPFSQVVQQEFSLEEAQAAFEYAVAHKPLRVGIRIKQESTK
jgi:putative phosphonate catabolism associated alcohol dehydrogenase